MIAFLRGLVHSVNTDHLVVLTGDLGRLVYVTPHFAASATRGEAIELHTFLVVREDSLTLYGFASGEERDIFQVLLGLSGVGPRLALATLSVFSPQQLKTIVSDNDTKTLSRVPGIGTKVAARMLLELPDKLSAFNTHETAPVSSASHGRRGDSEVVEGLIGLGWKQVAAEKAVHAALEELPDGNTSQLLRLALKHLGARV